MFNRKKIEYEEKIKSLKNYNGIQQVNLKITKEENELLKRLTNKFMEENKRLKESIKITVGLFDILIEHIIKLEEDKQNEKTH